MKLTDICKKATTPQAFSTYAAIGVIATTILTVICTRKQCKIESEKNFQTDISENKSEELTREEVIEEIKETAKVYVPAIASAVATIFCIKHSNSKWIDYNGFINASYITACDKTARYRALAPAAVGAELIQGLHGRKADEGQEWFCIKDFPNHEDIYFQSTTADVIYAEYHLNRNFQLRGSASVREFFAFLGILDMFPEEYEDYLGWDVGTMLEDGIEPWIDFEHNHVTDPSTGQIINTIYYTWEPQFSAEREPLAYGYMPIGSDVTSCSFGPTE